jgi:hypothetical protein
VRGSSSNGAGAVVSRETFHGSILAGAFRALVSRER